MNAGTSIKKAIRAVVGILKEKRICPIPQPLNCQKILDGKIAIITGGSGGIGKSIAESFLRCGCKVIITGTNEKKLEACCKDLDASLEFVKPVVLNVIQTDILPSKIEEAAAMFPEHRIDILVNAAGITSCCDFLDATAQEYSNVMDINVKGMYFVSQAVSRHMIQNGIKGHILNVSSSSALRNASTPYTISKWAVKGFTLGLAEVLLPYGIVVNAIAPGPTATPMVGKNDTANIALNNQPSGRYAMPNEISSLAAFMVSDFGNMIVGDTFYITGGSGTIDLRY